MDKIIHFALSTKFGKDIENIMEIITATPNPQVATEVLLGLYSEPEIENRNELMHNEDSDKMDIMFTSYDKYTDEVSYQYYPIEKKFAWFKHGDDITEANIGSKTRWADDAARAIGISESELKENYHFSMYSREISSTLRTSRVSRYEWNKLVEKSIVIFHPDLATLADAEYEARISM